MFLYSLSSDTPRCGVCVLSSALEAPDVTDLVLVHGSTEQLQRGKDDEDGGFVIGVASWTLGELYRVCVNHICDADLTFTVGILVACPGHLRAWNNRKRGLQRGALKLSNELHFNSLILRRAPKCAEAWAHRRWLLRQDTCKINDELQVVRHSMRRAVASYYAGVHFLLVLARCDPSDACDAVRDSREFLCTHPRDSTAWAVHRTALRKAAGLVELNEENAFLDDMVRRYKVSQAVNGHSKWWSMWRDSIDTHGS